jgi:hypothetical protein
MTGPSERPHRWCISPPRGVLLLVTVAFVLILVGLGVFPAHAAGFPDVPGNHPYETAINNLAARGIILGFPDGHFGPGEPVSRQQFAKMIVLTLGLPTSEADICPFSDVGVSGPGSLYPDNYVAVAAKTRITVGTSPITFSPWGNISRYQVITMVVRAAEQLHPTILAVPPPVYQSTWDPASSAEHGAHARKAQYNGLLSVLPLGGLDPWLPMSRGEVAQVLHNLLQKLQPPQTIRTWIRYKISTAKMNHSPRIHGNHAAWLGIVGNRSQAFLHSIDTDSTIQIDTGPGWSHEHLDLQGNWLAIEASNGSQSDIFLYNISQGSVARLTNSPTDEKHPSISSGRVVWSGFDGSDWELYLHETGSGQTYRITNNTDDEEDPIVDGDWIVSSGHWASSADIDLFLNNIGSSYSRLLRTDFANDANYSLKGNFVVWEKPNTSGGTDIYLHDIAAAHTVNLTPSTEWGVEPTMDAGRIVWVTSDGNDSELILYNIASGTKTKITNNSFDDYSPHLAGPHLTWSADTTYPATDVYYRNLSLPGYGDIEPIILETIGQSAARNMRPRVSGEAIVWTREWIDYDIFLARKVDMPIIPIK